MTIPPTLVKRLKIHSRLQLVQTEILPDLNIWVWTNCIRPSCNQPSHRRNISMGKIFITTKIFQFHTLDLGIYQENPVTNNPSITIQQLLAGNQTTRTTTTTMACSSPKSSTEADFTRPITKTITTERSNRENVSKSCANYFASLFSLSVSFSLSSVLVCLLSRINMTRKVEQTRL